MAQALVIRRELFPLLCLRLRLRLYEVPDSGGSTCFLSQCSCPGKPNLFSFLISVSHCGVMFPAALAKLITICLGGDDGSMAVAITQINPKIPSSPTQTNHNPHFPFENTTPITACPSFKPPTNQKTGQVIKRIVLFLSLDTRKA